MTAQTTRDRILDALQRILVEHGATAITLEAVAAEAEVSKGGLLYHFRSKEALVQGLVDRLAEQAEDEYARAAESEGGIPRFFLESSLPSSDEARLYWSVIAALRSVDSGFAEVGGGLARIFTRWAELLHAEIPDPVLAETVRLVGDGLYLSAIAGLPAPEPERVRAVIDTLLAQVDAARTRG
ncbi:TetR/AcrR family transcriptional regulator [Allonocardiopsis opalescens]|uniref:TetR family transcriptional regulator n=1 Tax=Allonocardiopsis opalescens TaxID=1144618 RepID=A0A2T0PXN3_9ACTN|nr:TetR/AcrR family transcriptional regulator [Allonocardiopsis opalescens]PRX96198.1 TetR family transcriptional regulator [Allonocardiopsis opalescens]